MKINIKINENIFKGSARLMIRAEVKETFENM